MTPAMNRQSEDGSDEEFDSEEFEDVDLNVDSAAMNNDEEAKDFQYKTNEDGIQITINTGPDSVASKRRGKKKKQSHLCSHEERLFRRNIHMFHLFTMVGHGVVRNSWCTTPSLLKDLARKVPTKLKDELKVYNRERLKENLSAQFKTRKLLDLLRHLMEYWYKSWHVKKSYPFLYKKHWDELNDQSKTTISIDKSRFLSMIGKRKGSRDIAAQGFVALLRSLGLQARLVFSIQSPDFTNLSQVEKVTEKHTEKKKLLEREKRKNYQDKVKHNKPKGQYAKFMQSVRSNTRAYSNVNHTVEGDDEIAYQVKNYPVFWCEVWDKDSKKYITIDPIVKKIIEIVSTKSKLEPPLNNTRINSYYVIGYDRLGGVRDITRRYAENYNAKVRKKRITREQAGEEWFSGVLKGANSPKRKDA
ncbi:unnamed protein product [Ambrosiozyma monospora]|uniref:Unnamed protein product n=1 Tax=Ambrosiozyma monospora TaxID=43982 RepID=A0A9W6Z7U3_AMBMO|nr:unnamed protein product [Ambrosiozyma monospora]